MQRFALYASAAAALLLQVAATATQDPNVEKAPVVNDPSCPPRPEPEPAPTVPLDLSRSGLVFDPLAPGGARPEQREEIVPVPVNPRTVTLSPVTRGDQPDQPVTPLPEGKELETLKSDCRA